MSEERLIELETRCAYQEDAIAELSSAIAVQGGRIETLEHKVDALLKRLREAEREKRSGDLNFPE
ncbi:MAG: SlyX family protein [Pseudomonadota bacterium]